ncbi:unnamed protein product [Closterium sp. Naga37s-1]|nr:unnamed protein product [Closterium sp. Naga37s-1]
MLLAEPASGFEADALPGWLGDTYRSTPNPKAAAAEPEPGLNEPRIVRLSWKPRAWIYKNFLTHAECDHIIELARPKMERSTVLADNGSSVVDDYRSSSGCFLDIAQDDVIRRIEDRLATWTFLPPENQESMQVLRYAVGQKYDAHHDYFEEDEKQQQGGHRYATVLMYLTDGFSGGETVFPDSEKDKQEKDDTWSDCGKQGVAGEATAKPVKGDALLFFSLKPSAFPPPPASPPFPSPHLPTTPPPPSPSQASEGRCAALLLPEAPVKGDALLFFSLKPSAEPDLASLHAGCPVLAGEKWSATKWIHPVKGDALLFFSLKPSAEPDLASLHAGCPVLAGEKWSATKWIHVRSFEEEDEEGVGSEGGGSSSSQSHPPGACVDESEHCVPWAKAGECEKNPGYMQSSCARSCGKCSVLAASA